MPRNRGNVFSNARTKSGTKRGNFTYSISVDPPPFKLAAMYQDIAAELTDFRPAWPGIAKSMGRHLGTNITSKGSPIGEKWKPLSRPYSKRKSRAGGGGRPLVRTGDMLRELSKGTIVSSGRSFLSVGLRGAEWLHAPAMNFGYTKGNIPRRAFMGFSAAMIKDAERMMGERVQDVLDTAASDFNRSK